MNSYNKYTNVKNYIFYTQSNQNSGMFRSTLIISRELLNNGKAYVISWMGGLLKTLKSVNTISADMIKLNFNFVLPRIIV